MIKIYNKQLLVAVTVILGVTCVLLFNGYKNVSDSYVYISEEIALQENKREIMASMYNASRERSLILLQMLAEKDSFELDKLNRALDTAAYQFIHSRQKLEDLRLSKEEKNFLQKQNKLAQESQPLLQQVAELIISGHRSTANVLLFSSAIPVQNKVMQHIAAVIKLYGKKLILWWLMLGMKMKELGNNFLSLRVALA